MSKLESEQTIMSSDIFAYVEKNSLLIKLQGTLEVPKRFPEGLT